MKHAQVLDCTLRDGAYLVDKWFGNKVIKGIIKGLLAANIDIIEIGFLQDIGQSEGKTIYKNSKDAEKFIPAIHGETQFTVLADFSRYSIENLDNYTGKSFDGVRACFFKNERYDVIAFCEEIIKKGYKLFVQPVDILGYTDIELIELIENINQIEPYCFSIVDTFGSMYADDLQRIYNLINHNLDKNVKIGFHSHNNMQMSSALSQEFLKLSFGNRQVVVDGTISGMGRGAGNTPTELIIQYMVSKLGYTYDIDALLDVIDGYMENIKMKCSWGYSTSYFIAGSYGAHVNNIAYLKNKNSIRSRDIRLILNKLGSRTRKKYNYDILENEYIQCVRSDIDDQDDFQKLKDSLCGKNILTIAPGNSAGDSEAIRNYVRKNQPIIIAINFIHPEIKADYLYFSNVKRYNYWENSIDFEEYKKIITSNICEKEKDSYVVSFNRVIKCGWEHMDCSAIMLLRLLDQLEVMRIGIIGLDGYDFAHTGKSNYISDEMNTYDVNSNPMEINQEIQEMLIDFKKTRTNNCTVEFLTHSRFSDIFEVSING